MRVGRAVFSFVLAGGLAVALDSASVALAPRLGEMARALGFLVFVLPILAAALAFLPPLLLAVLWLRDLGASPLSPGPLAVLRATLAAWGQVLLLLVVNAVALIPAGLLVASLFAVSLRTAGSLRPDLWTLSAPAWALGLCSLLLALWFLPAILRRAAGAPAGAVAYRGFARWLAAALLCLGTALLTQLADHTFTSAIEVYVEGVHHREGPPPWLATYALPVVETGLTALLLLALWHLLRQPVPAVAAAAGQGPR